MLSFISWSIVCWNTILISHWLSYCLIWEPLILLGMDILKWYAFVQTFNSSLLISLSLAIINHGWNRPLSVFSFELWLLLLMIVALLIVFISIYLIIDNMSINLELVIEFSIFWPVVVFLIAIYALKSSNSILNVIPNLIRLLLLFYLLYLI